MAVAEGPERREWHWLVQPEPAAPEVVHEQPARRLHPHQHEGQVAETPGPTRKLGDLKKNFVC